MDTRTKIITKQEAQALVSQGAVLVRGYFDPITLWHAEKLAELKNAGGPLIVAVSTPTDPIMPVRARMQMVAGFRAVDYVTEMTPGLGPAVNLEQDDRAELDRLIALVSGRQQA